jgi:hypothetical protein
MPVSVQFNNDLCRRRKRERERRKGENSLLVFKRKLLLYVSLLMCYIISMLVLSI